MTEIKKYLLSLFLLGICITLPCRAESSGCTVNSLADVIKKMQTAVENLKTLSADMEYLYIQDPELIDAKTLQKGNLYYKTDEKESKILISFLTRQQDEEPIQKRPEYYLFDGIWFTKIDTKLETIDRYQKAPEDKPVGVFEFISHNFPMVGFTDPNTLEKEFTITIPTEQLSDSTHLNLKVKKDSTYKEDYTEMDVWVNNSTWLPIRLTAWSTQGDFYDLRWTDIKINKKLENAVFTIETPAHFRKNTHPLKEQTERN